MTLSEVRAAIAAQDWAGALCRIEMLLNGAPDDANTVAAAYHLGASCLSESGDLAQSLSFAQSAALIKPHNAAAWCQLGLIHYLMAGSGSDHYIEAHVCFERATTMAPHAQVALCGLGSSAFTLGQYDMALELFRRAQKPLPSPKARLAEAGVLLKLGHYPEGWEKFEARVALADGSKTPAYHGSLADLRDVSVVVRAEQGNGDNIQFMRYIPHLRQFCRDITVETFPGLEALLASFTGVRVVTAPYLADRDSVSINIMSLPLLLGGVVGWEPLPPMTVPGQFIGPRGGIGVCTASVPRIGDSAMVHAIARRKTPPFDLFGHLAKWFGSFRSLDHVDLGTADWLETAMIVAGLDLVITVDTAIAHLAASLGVSTWVLQRYDACWRWNEGWYPSCRLFRQSAPGDWGSVFRAVHLALEQRQGGVAIDISS